METTKTIEIRETTDPMPDIVTKEDTGFFSIYNLDASVIKQTTREEEIDIVQQNAVIASGLFQQARKHFRDLFKAMLAKIFEEFNVQKKDGIDIGSGATGEMVHHFLPLTEGERATWIEFDLNPTAVAIHKTLHPRANMRQASYLQLRRSLKLSGTVDTVTGLSTLDATNHLDTALNEIRHTLCIGGFFVHVQDVRPGIQYGINELEHQGYKRPFQAIVGGPTYPNGLPNPFGYVTNQGSVSSVELFRQTVGRRINAATGLRLIKNQWFVATAPRNQTDQYAEYFQCMLNTKPALQERRAYAVVTVVERTD